MEQFIISGPTKLSGHVSASGSKNAALPIIAASVLTRGEVTLANVPDIRDIRSMLEILADLGAKYTFSDNVLRIDCTAMKNQDPEAGLIRKLRASILLVAPLLVRNKKVSLPHPGGCLIGARPVDVHLEGLKKLGAKVVEKKDEYTIAAPSLTPAGISADFSVTGTENIMMAAVLTPGTTKISLAAAEPHVVDLGNFLNACGAKISGLGTHNLTIVGTARLAPITYTICPDQIEAGTFAIAAAASGGEVTVNGFLPKCQESLLAKFDRAGLAYELAGSSIKVRPTKNLKCFNVRTEIYPGFPTDLQAPMAVLATQCVGTSQIHETIFEGRLGYCQELSKMGAACVLRDSHQAEVTGPTPLAGTRITSFDLRAGATLIIAAIIARGESRLDQIEIIDRGYENIEEKFRALGANIKRVKLKEIES